MALLILSHPTSPARSGRSGDKDWSYPALTSGLFVKGGAGLAVRCVETLFSGTHDGSRLGITAGAGYDLRIARNVSLTPMATYYHGDIGALSSTFATSTA